MLRYGVTHGVGAGRLQVKTGNLEISKLNHSLHLEVNFKKCQVARHGIDIAKYILSADAHKIPSRTEIIIHGRVKRNSCSWF